MPYCVQITGRAPAGAGEYVHVIRDVNGEREAAGRRFHGLVEAILSLEVLPSPCPRIPEQDEFRLELRHWAYFSHRVVFHVSAATQTVTVLRIYHAARRRRRPSDLSV